VAADLQSIYGASTMAEAEQHLEALKAKWKAYPSVSQVWRWNWARITPFFNYPPWTFGRRSTLPTAWSR
jgi:transposase-like protein